MKSNQKTVEDLSYQQEQPTKQVRNDEGLHGGLQQKANELKSSFVQG